MAIAAWSTSFKRRSKSLFWKGRPSSLLIISNTPMVFLLFTMGTQRIDRGLWWIARSAAPTKRFSLWKSGMIRDFPLFATQPETPSPNFNRNSLICRLFLPFANSRFSSCPPSSMRSRIQASHRISFWAFSMIMFRTFLNSNVEVKALPTSIKNESCCVLWRSSSFNFSLATRRLEPLFSRFIF